MKPLNLDNKPCSPISSNCVVWQGPDIPCIHLCTGDTVSDVVHKLATELCEVLETLKVSNYDLTCFSTISCGPENFQELVQFILDQLCISQGGIPASVGGTTIPITGIRLPIDTGPSKVPSGGLQQLTPEGGVIGAKPRFTTARASETCPDCVVTVPDEFVVGTQRTMQLVDYAVTMGEKIASIVGEVSLINNQITDITIRVSDLENKPAPNITLPPVNVTCGSFPLAGSQEMDAILDSFINTVWCNFYSATGTTTDIINAIGASCISEASFTISNPAATFGTQYAGSWINSPLSTLSSAVNNIWIALCDIYNFLNSTNLVITVADTNTVNLELSAAKELTAKVQDTGWVELEGFDFYTTLSRPECRRVGNVIHYRGVVVVPLLDPGSGNAVSMVDTNSTASIVGKTPYAGGGVGSVTVDPVTQLITFNGGNSIIPASVVASQKLDGDTIVADPSILKRPLLATNNHGTVLNSACKTFLNDSGVLTLASLKASEIVPVAGGNNLFGSSSLRLITSNVRLGEVVPNYISANSDIHSFPTPIAFDNTLGYSIGDVIEFNNVMYVAVVNIATPVAPAVTPNPDVSPGSWNVFEYPLQTDVYLNSVLPAAYTISIDAGKVEDLGGFFFSLDGTTSFVDCATSIPSSSCY